MQNEFINLKHVSDTHIWIVVFLNYPAYTQVDTTHMGILNMVLAQVSTDIILTVQ